jgi:hypothetical protein
MVFEAIMPFSSVELEDGPKAEKRVAAGTLERKEAWKMVVQSTIQIFFLSYVGLCPLLSGQLSIFLIVTRSFTMYLL